MCQFSFLINESREIFYYYFLFLFQMNFHMCIELCVTYSKYSLYASSTDVLMVAYQILRRQFPDGEFETNDLYFHLCESLYF